MLTWRNARVVLLLAVVVAVAAGWFLSQREATPVTDQQGPAERGCVGEACLTPTATATPEPTLTAPEQWQAGYDAGYAAGRDCAAAAPSSSATPFERGYQTGFRAGRWDFCPDQRPPTPTPMLDWPAFTVTYESDGPYAPRELRRLEYTDRKNWRVETIRSEDFSWGQRRFNNRTGSWKQQSGTSYMDYDSVTGETFSRTLNEARSMAADSFSDSDFWGFDLDTRSDYTLVPHHVDVCTADDCHVVPSGTSGQTTPMGRTYPMGRLYGIVFTNDQYGIPLVVEGTSIDILELQLLPTTPDPEACETNLRGLWGSEILEAQQWNDSCNTSDDSRSRSHFYTFTIDETLYVSFRASSNTDGMLMELWSGTAKSGSSIHWSFDGLHESLVREPSAGHAYHVGFDYELAAGTYTIEVASLTIGNTDGTFLLDIEVRQPYPISPLPEPRISVEVLPDDRWRFSWHNTGTSSYVAQLSRTDGSWQSAAFAGSGEVDSIELPIREPFVRHEPYQFRLILRGDDTIYTGEHDFTIDVIHPEPVATATPTPTSRPTATPTPTPTPTPTATPVPLLPNQVRNLSISDTGLVTWDAPTDEVDGYRVLYRKGNPVGWPNRANLSSDVRTYQLPDFDAGAMYSVRVGTLWGPDYLYPESWVTVTR